MFIKFGIVIFLNNTHRNYSENLLQNTIENCTKKEENDECRRYKIK